MTGDEFITAAQELYGAKWPDKIAAVLGISARTIYRIRQAKRVPKTIEYSVVLLLAVNRGTLIYPL